MNKTKDALSRDINIGDIIGYAVNRNGRTISFKGKIIKITDRNAVTVEIIDRFAAFYTDNVEPDYTYPSKTVTCKANCCIKLNDQYENK